MSKCSECGTEMPEYDLKPVKVKINTDQSPRSLRKTLDRKMRRATFRVETRLICDACIETKAERRKRADLKRAERVRLIGICCAAAVVALITLTIALFYESTLTR